MSKTTTDLVNAAYAVIAVSKDAPQSEDTAIITSYVVPIQSDLANRRIIAIADINAIPDGVFPDLVTILAEKAAPYYGRPTNLQIVAAAESGLREIDRLARSGPTALTQAALQQLEAIGASSDAIDATAVAAEIPRTLDDLSVGRIVTYTNEGAIPPAAFQHVALLVAARCRPNRPDAAWPSFAPQVIADAEERLRLIGRLDRNVGTPLVNSVLERLEALGAGSRAIDRTAVMAQVQPTLDELKAQRVISITDETRVTSAELQPLAVVIASRCRPGAVPADEVAGALSALAKIARLDRTQDPLVLAVQEQLLIFGQSKDTLDGTMIASAIPDVLAELAARNIIYVASTDDVQDSTRRPLARYIAASLSSPPLDSLKNVAAAELREMRAVLEVLRPIEGCYF